MSGAALALRQYRFDQRQFWREPAAVFFTVILPLIFLVLFVSIFGNDDIEVRGHEISGSTYYLPGILTLSLASATFVNLTITMTEVRESGALKRLRATPVPAWVVIAGRALTALALAGLMTVVLILIGWLAYDVDPPGSTIVGLVLAVIVGSVALSALGFAVCAFVPSRNAAPPVANAVALPLYFISGVFVPSDQLPDWMQKIGDALPFKPLFDALLTAFDPFTTGTGIEPGELAILAGWGIVGGFVALRWFRWMPRG